jgi:hypothetical protein
MAGINDDTKVVHRRGEVTVCDHAGSSRRSQIARLCV